MKDGLNNGEKARGHLCVSLSCLWLELNVLASLRNLLLGWNLRDWIRRKNYLVFGPFGITKGFLWKLE